MVAETPDWASVTGVPYIARIASRLQRPAEPVWGFGWFPPSAVTTARSRRSVVGQLRSTTAPRGREGIPMITTADAPHVLFRRF